VSCLGLLGLTTFTAEQRKKEIGIRKVLGARVITIVGLLSNDFLKLVLIAILVATPLAWSIMSGWLENFAYRILLEWWMFLLAGVLMITVAVVVVSLQAMKAAMANPVKNLRSE
jgi:ABC-type antimicrobial peptide transport system permease subunit